MFTFLTDALDSFHGHPITPFLVFFVYVWTVWTAKALAARRYRPSTAPRVDLGTTVLVPVFREPEELFRSVLASVRANGPTEMIAVIDGGDPALAGVAAELCDH